MNRQPLYRAAIIVGVVNYLAFAATATLMGDAVHGYSLLDRFYVAVNGGFVEVARTTFQFCRWQTYSLLLTFPLGLWCGSLLAPTPHDADETLGGHEHARLSPHAS